MGRLDLQTSILNWTRWVQKEPICTCPAFRSSPAARPACQAVAEPLRVGGQGAAGLCWEPLLSEEVEPGRRGFLVDEPLLGNTPVVAFCLLTKSTYFSECIMSSLTENAHGVY